MNVAKSICGSAIEPEQTTMENQRQLQPCVHKHSVLILFNAYLQGPRINVGRYNRFDGAVSFIYCY